MVVVSAADPSRLRGQLFAEFAQGQQRVGGTIDASAQVITIAAARLFGAERVEMLLRHPEGLLRYVGDDTGVEARLRVDADAWDEPWALRALAARGVLLGADGDRPYCSAVLGDPERPQAVLIAHRPARAAVFNRAEAKLAGVLVSQAESWLSVAELSAKRDEAVGRAEAYGAANRVLGDISQETVPALAVLRESAHRLSRLATRFEVRPRSTRSSPSCIRSSARSPPCSARSRWPATRTWTARS